MPIDFGDVALVPFPFTNQAAAKQRPAVIVSNRVYNLARRPPSSWRLRASKPVFATLEQSLFIRRLGTLTKIDQTAIRTAIGAILG
jgi:mRNA interferase MazF